jgi:hypothetical protein
VKRWSIIAWLTATVLSAPAHAAPAAAIPPPSAASEVCPDAAGRVSFALGLSLAEELRADYGASTRAAFAPELLGLAYLPLPARQLYLRAGVRVGYDGLGQADMPREVKVVEHGLHELLELGLLFDWVVTPAISFGGGLTERSIKLDTRGSVHGTGAFDHSELLGVLYGSLGLGIPIERGLIVLEPFVRLGHTFSDDRALVRLGLDATLRL